MGEAEFYRFSTFFTVGIEWVYAGLFAAFFRPFLPGREGRGKQLLLFAAYLLLELACHRTALPQGLLGPVLLALLLALSLWIGLKKAQIFLLVLLYWNARISSGLMAESLYFILERLLPACDGPLEAIFLRAAGFIVLFLLTHFLLFAAMLAFLRQQLARRRMPLQWRELCYLSLVPTAGILFGQVISRLLFEVRDGVLLQLYERHPAFLAVVPLLALLFYAGACLSIVFQQGMAALQEEQAIWFAERRQLQAIQGRIQEAEQFYSQIRSLRHEMRGHLTNIQGLAHKGEYASLKEYIRQMDCQLRGTEPAVQTGNPVTDVIIGDFCRQSQKQGIGFQAAFSYPASGGYDSFDVGIILQNLLQNAAEACGKVPEGQRAITVSGRQKGRFFLIEVTNTFAGQVDFGQDGLPASTKADPLAHGIGLANVRRSAEKYMGELELKTEGQTFFATVLLQERSSL